MGYPFPSEEWFKRVVAYLNSDEKYAQTAKNWEGDLVFKITPNNASSGETDILYYMDLWHGKCRGSSILASIEDKPQAKFILELTKSQAIKMLEGELDPVQAMVTRKLKVRGNVGYMLRNVPVVLDFVRVCRRVEIEE